MRGLAPSLRDTVQNICSRKCGGDVPATASAGCRYDHTVLERRADDGDDSRIDGSGLVGLGHVLIVDSEDAQVRWLFVAPSMAPILFIDNRQQECEV